MGFLKDKRASLEPVAWIYLHSYLDGTLNPKELPAIARPFQQIIITPWRALLSTRTGSDQNPSVFGDLECTYEAYSKKSFDSCQMVFYLSRQVQLSFA
jgi:hypothetical protein